MSDPFIGVQHCPLQGPLWKCGSPWEESWSRAEEEWIWIQIGLNPSLLLTSYVTLDKSLKLSEPLFPHL